MTRQSKRRKEVEKTVSDDKKLYTPEDAIALLQKCPSVKFDQSVEISMKMGVDPKKSDQQVRATVSLPKGTGKTVRVLVFASGDKIKEAKDAGADIAGNEEIVQKIQSGWVDFDAVIATPDMMREVGKLGKVLGPRGLMPSPKAGTVTTDVATAVKEIKAGKIEFKVDKSAVINNILGKLSFQKEDLIENMKAFLQAILRVKPASAKGVYIRSVYLSSTMGPGLKVDVHSII